MAGAPRWKVYDAAGNYQAALKEPEAAAAVVAFYGKNATIRLGHAKRDIVWTEGASGEAFDSYDKVADHCEAGRQGRVAANELRRNS